jgi:hypothetical protein
MKANKCLPLGLAAAGVAIAGAVIFFTSTKKGRMTKDKWNMQGKKMTAEIKEIINEAKRKIKELKHEMLQDCSTGDPEKDVLQSS